MTPILAALALALAQPAPAAAADDKPDLAALQQVYDQSCAAREYGAYDDMCDQLKTQIRAIQIGQQREARRRPAHPLTRPPAPAPVTPAASASPTAALAGSPPSS